MRSGSAISLPIGPVTISFPRLEDVAHDIAKRQRTGAVHLCNAYTVALADESPEYLRTLSGAAFNIPDGTPLVWLARRRGAPEAERVYGPDLMERTLDLGRTTRLRHYLYGSTPEVLDALEAAIERRWPGVSVVGVESPPFREITDLELSASLRRAESLGADVVWVGMGTPKQDYLAARMAAMSGAAIVAIGAAFDFIAGTKPQAPRWVMRLGMEWAFRLLSEPRRLWRRYLVYNWRFLRAARRSTTAAIR